MAVQSNTLPVLPKKIITSDGDVNVGNLDSQVQLFSSTEPPTPGESHAVLLPCNPQLGQSHKIIAVSAGATLDGNGAPILRAGVVDPNALAAGECVELTFAKDPAGNGCGCAGSEGGAWIGC